MKEYKQAIIASAIILLIGLVLLYFSNSISVPSAHKTFLGIPYATTEDYASTAHTKALTLFSGFLIIGIGLGCAVSIYPIYDLEQKKSKSQQPKKTTYD